MSDHKKKKSKKSIYNAIGFSNKDIDKIKGVSKKIGNTKIKDVPKHTKRIVKSVAKGAKELYTVIKDEYKYQKKEAAKDYAKKVDKVRRKYRPKDYDSKGKLKKNH